MKVKIKINTIACIVLNRLNISSKFFHFPLVHLAYSNIFFTVFAPLRNSDGPLPLRGVLNISVIYNIIQNIRHLISFSPCDKHGWKRSIDVIMQLSLF